MECSPWNMWSICFFFFYIFKIQKFLRRTKRKSNMKFLVSARQLVRSFFLNSAQIDVPDVPVAVSLSFPKDTFLCVTGYAFFVVITLINHSSWLMILREFSQLLYTSNTTHQLYFTYTSGKQRFQLGQLWWLERFLRFDNTQVAVGWLGVAETRGVDRRGMAIVRDVGRGEMGSKGGLVSIHWRVDRWRLAHI